MYITTALWLESQDTTILYDMVNVTVDSDVSDNVTDGYMVTDNMTSFSNVTDAPVKPQPPPRYVPTAYQKRVNDAANNIMIYLSPIMVAVGILGNGVSLVIMRSSYFNKSPSSFALSALAVVDSCNLVAGLLIIWVEYKFKIIVNYENTAACKLTFFLVYFFAGLSSWTVVAVTLERAISVIFPFKAKEICSRRNTKILLLTLYVSIACMYLYLLILPSIQTYTLPTNVTIRFCAADMKHRVKMADALYYQDTLVNSCIPASLIFVGNLMIIIRLTKARRKREAMNSGAQKQTGANSTTVMLIAISITFFITTLPLTIFSYEQNNWFDLTTVNGLVERSLTFSILTQLFYTNSMINFWMYFLTGKRFRDAFMAIFIPCRKKPPTRPSTSQATSTTSANGGTSTSQITKRV